MRILVGLLWHEGNSFNPLNTTQADFTITRGRQLIEEYEVSDTALGGILRCARRHDIEIVPTVGARARPGGAVDQSLVDALIAEFVVGAMNSAPDAVCLELHGATIASEDPDVEGTLLSALRNALGADIPIVAAADLHGYITARMMNAANIITGYRTNPHSDMAETGERALLLTKALLDGARPTLAHTRVPLLLSGNDWTSTGPLSLISKKAEELRSDPRISDISIFNTQPQLDCLQTGQSVLVYGRDPAFAAGCARLLAAGLWTHRTEFRSRLATLENVLGTMTEGPVALGDFGDRVLGGAPGDSLAIVERIRERWAHLRVMSYVFDPEAVERARQAGPGSQIELALGAAISSRSLPEIRPLRARWTVGVVGEAKFRNRGPYMAGVTADLGEYAILSNDNTTVIATTKAPNVHDPEAFESLGMPIASHDVVVLKSGMHFHLSFADVCPTWSVSTPGLSTDDLALLPFRVARPIFPLDPIDWHPDEP